MFVTSSRSTVRRLVRLIVLAALVIAAAPAAATAGTAHLRIIGGYTPASSQWPWMAALLDTSRGSTDFDQQFCGAALVAPRLVLTAAHCVVDKRTGQPRTTAGLSVLLGKRQLRTAGGGERLAVGKIVVHPHYARIQDVDHDLAVLYLASSSSAQPAALLGTEASLRVGSRVTTMGWGGVQAGTSPAYTDQLKAVDNAIWSDAQCQAAGVNETDRAIYRRLYDAGSMICAGYADTADTTCQGDSGGPMMIPDTSGTWRLVGMVSWGGIGCSGRTSPTVYAWLGAPSMDGFVRAHIARAGAVTAVPSGQPTPAPANEPGSPVAGPGVAGPAPTPRPSSGAPSTGNARVTLLVRLSRTNIRVGRSIKMRVTAGRGGSLVVSARRGGRLARSWRLSVPRSGTYTVSLPTRSAGRSLSRGRYSMRVELRSGGARSRVLKRAVRVR